MKQLRYLESIELDKKTRTQNENGSYLETYTKQNDYLVQVEEIRDSVSASIYGARIDRMSRISSPRRILENVLYPLVNTSSDNISLYSVVLNSARYKIVAVNKNWIDIELL